MTADDSTDEQVDTADTDMSTDGPKDDRGGETRQPEPGANKNRESKLGSEDTGQHGKTGTSDAPGSSEFRKRDRTVREQRWLGEQTLSGSSRGFVTAHGPVAMGDSGIAIGTAYFSTQHQRVSLSKGPLSRTWLDARRKSFVETSAYRNLVERLAQCRVQVLRGPDGSGRTTTAFLALDRVIYPFGQMDHGADSESDVEMLDSALDPDAITKDDLQEGHGYLLDRSNTDLEGQLNLAFLGQLKTLARDCEAFLVLIVGDRARLDQDNLGDYLVLQDRPAPTEMLKAHLRCLEGGTDVPWTGELRDEVKRELEAAPAPGQVAELARYLAGEAIHKLSGDDILAGFGERLIERARTKLARPFGDDDKGEPRSRAEVLCRRAQLIACAVLDRMPLVTVMDAAVSLARLLHDVQTGGRPLPRPVFSGTVDGLLEYAEATDHSDDEAPDEDDVTRRIRMRPGLAAAVLGIAWRDYDTVRKPLLDWLEELALHRDQALRVRAPIAIGKLASYDFEYIFENIIHQWADCRDCHTHWQAAAWALEMAAHDPLLTVRVRDRVRRWCHGRSFFRQRTALFAFTTMIGVQHVEDTLDGLCLLATQGRHADDYALAHALREIFLAGFHEEAHKVLDTWAHGDKRGYERPLVVQAARSLLTLSEGTGELNGDPTSVLVSLFADDPKWRDTVRQAWRLALEEPATSEDGWNVLWFWLRRGGREPRFVEPLIGLVTDLARDPEFRSRIRFRQLFWKTNKARWHPAVDDILTRALAANDGFFTATA
ncbi:MAG: hypothetical protein ACRDZO_10620 [Egibacteraceae bacterium]